MRGIQSAACALALAAIAIYSGFSTDRSGSHLFAATAPRAVSSASEPPAFPGADAFVRELSNPFLGFARGRIFRYESRLPGPKGERMELVSIKN